jgi:hypothetical protein
VLLPAALSALALGVAALEWQAMHVLSDVQPDAWHLAYQQREPGDWFDQMSVAFFSSQICAELIMLATFVALVFGALGYPRQMASKPLSVADTPRLPFEERG